MADTFGAELQAKMTEQGLSVNKLAGSTGVANETIAAILKGKATPQAKTVNKLAQAVGLPLVEVGTAPTATAAKPKVARTPKTGKFVAPVVTVPATPTVELGSVIAEVVTLNGAELARVAEFIGFVKFGRTLNS